MKTCIAFVIGSGLITLLICGIAALYLRSGGYVFGEWLITSWWLVWLVSYAVLLTAHTIGEEQ